MTTFRQKLHPVALIPWVIALVALFGSNVLAHQKTSLRKSAHLDGGSVTQLADECPPSGPTGKPLTGLIGPPVDGIKSRSPVARRAVALPRLDTSDTSRRGGAVHGRAPPAAV